MNYSRFSNLGYAPHTPHAYLGDRVVNPVMKTKKRENYSEPKSESKSEYVIDYNLASDKPSFQNFLRDHPVAFVWFHAKWCGHCKVMVKEYENVAKNLHDRVSFIKVDADEYSELCAAYGVQGFPTLILFKNGKDSSIYPNKRTADAFQQWLLQNI